MQGANPPGFDYAFNLGYGRAHTDAHPLIAALREPVDAETARLAGLVAEAPWRASARLSRLSGWLRTSSSPRRVMR